MSDFDEEQERAQRFVERAFPEVAAFLADERSLPTYGPSQVFDDEGITPHVIVRVAVALSREQLITAFALGSEDLLPDVDPASLSADEVRREVEGYFANGGIVEIDTTIAEGRPRTESLAAAVERAYPEVAR